MQKTLVSISKDQGTLKDIYLTKVATVLSVTAYVSERNSYNNLVSTFRKLGEIDLVHGLSKS